MLIFKRKKKSWLKESGTNSQKPVQFKLEQIQWVISHSHSSHWGSYSPTNCIVRQLFKKKKNINICRVSLCCVILYQMYVFNKCVIGVKWSSKVGQLALDPMNLPLKNWSWMKYVKDSKCSVHDGLHTHTALLVASEWRYYCMLKHVHYTE